MPTNTNLYSYNPGTANVADATPATASNASASNATGYLSQAKDAAAQSYTAQTQQVDPASLTSNRLNTITSQDSPIMQRARQEGMLLAAKRGLQNSSIAAGAAQGAMVDRATPLAQQESSMLQEQALANQTATNKASSENSAEANESARLNAQLGTSTSQQNAALQTDVSKQNAAMGTDVSKFNAGSATDVSKFNSETQARANEQNAAASNAMRQKVVEENAALNRQYLSGEQTMTLADIQGKYQQLISSNAAAAQLYDSYFQSISQTMANNDIDPARVAQTVQQQQQMLNAGLSLIQNMSGMVLGGSSPVGGSNSYPPSTPYQPSTTTTTPYQPSIGTTPGSGPIMTTPESAPGALTRERNPEAFV